MTNTHEQRKEIAEKLRGVSEDEYSLMFLDELLDGLLGGCRDGECQISDRKIMLRLADLIDPTCEIVEDEPYSCHCSACGQGRMYPQMYWRYCPHCGARMVRANE